MFSIAGLLLGSLALGEIGSIIAVALPWFKRARTAVGVVRAVSEAMPPLTEQERAIEQADRERRRMDIGGPMDA